MERGEKGGGYGGRKMWLTYEFPIEVNNLGISEYTNPSKPRQTIKGWKEYPMFLEKAIGWVEQIDNERIPRVPIKAFIPRKYQNTYVEIAYRGPKKSFF